MRLLLPRLEAVLEVSRLYECPEADAFAVCALDYLLDVLGAPHEVSE